MSNLAPDNRATAIAMRADGRTFTEIGAALGISRQWAHYLCRGDGSAEVRIVLPGDLLARIDERPEERPAAIVAILRCALFR